MSNFRAIATVTATLQSVLQAAVHTDVPGAGVSTVRPSDAANGNLPATRVNLSSIRSRRTRTATISTCRLAAAGRPGAAAADRARSALSDELLRRRRPRSSRSGCSEARSALLHSQPLITRAQIEAAIADAGKPFLANSDLADQPELVRFTPAPMSLEELSRLWSVMLQVHYVLSVAYKASVVLVERAAHAAAEPATRAVNLAAVPMRQPFILKVLAQAGEGVPITPGSAVEIDGANLGGPAIEVDIDGAAVALSSAQADRIALTLPATLAAGPHSVQVPRASRSARTAARVRRLRRISACSCCSRP